MSLYKRKNVYYAHKFIQCVDALPQILSAAETIIYSLAAAILSNADKILASAESLISSVGKMIIDNLPMIIELGLQLVSDLALGIAQALPTLIPTIISVILQIAEISSWASLVSFQLMYVKSSKESS